MKNMSVVTLVYQPIAMDDKLSDERECHVRGDFEQEAILLNSVIVVNYPLHLSRACAPLRCATNVDQRRVLRLSLCPCALLHDGGKEN